jgi:hypothetical protein
MATLFRLGGTQAIFQKQKAILDKKVVYCYAYLALFC